MKISRILGHGIATLLPLTPLLTHAAEDTLSGAGGAVQPGLAWAAIGGWSLGAIPTAADNAVITATGLIDLRGESLGGSTTIQDLTFNSTAAVTLNNNSATTDMLLVLNGGRGAGVPLISTIGNFAYNITGPGTNATPHPLGLRLGASGDISVAANVLTISAVISETGGARGFTKTGAGRLNLSGTNVFTGGVTVAAGILEVLSAGALGFGPALITGGTLEVNVAAGSLSTGSITVNAGGQLALRNVAINNGVTLNGGTLGTRTGDLSNLIGEVSVSAASTVALRSYSSPANSQSITVGGLLTGSAALNIAGNATNTTKAFILTNPGNTYSGAFVVEAAQILRSIPATTGNTLGTAGVTLSGSTLQLRDDGTGSGGVLSYGNNLVVQTAASTVDVQRVAANTGNTIQLGTLAMGAQTLNVTGANGYGLRVGAASLTGHAIFNPTTAPLTVSGGISGAFTVTKTGAGDITLGAASTFSGQTNISAGTLKLTGTMASTPRIEVSTGATFDVSGGSFTLSGTQTLSGTGSVTGTATIGNGGKIEPGDALGIGALTFAGLTFGTGAGQTASVRVNPTGIPTRINVTGALAANGGAGSVTFNLTVPPTTVGQHPLIDYTGTIGGTGFGAFALGGLSPRVTAALVNNTGNTSIDLNVTLVDFPVWSGGVSAEWSTATIANPKNWKLNTATTATDFLTGDDAVFNDTATATTADVSVSDVLPTSVRFSNTTKDFTLSGSRAIAGAATFTKDGTGTVTVANTNSFTGAVTLNAGTVSVAVVADGGVNSPLGSGAGVTFNGGTLEFLGASGSTNRALTVNAGGAVLKTVTTLTLSGVLSGAGPVTKTGTGTVVLSGAAANTGTGTTTVSGGTLILTKTSGVNAIGGDLIVGPGGTVAYGTTTGQFANHIPDTAGITINGGTFGSGAGATPAAPTTGVTETVANVTVNSGTFLSGRGPVTAPAVIPTPFTVTGQFQVLGGSALVSRGGGLSAAALLIAAPGVLNLDGGSATASNESRLTIGAGGLTLTGAAVNLNAGPSTVAANSVGSIVFLNGNVTSTGASSFVRQNATQLAPRARIDLGGGTRTFAVEGTLDIGTLAAPVEIRNGSVTKTGGGTLNLNGPQAYATLTTSGGTTNVNTTLGTGTSSVNAGATTNFHASQTLSALTIGAGAVVTFGTVPEAAPAAGATSAFGAGSVPEPGTLSLLIFGALGVLARRRRGPTVVG